MIGRLKFFIKIFFVVFVIAGIGFFIFSSGLVKNIFSEHTGTVKGASTQKAQEITGNITSDITGGVDGAKKHVLNMKISEFVIVLSRVQKIPQDIHAGEHYIREQVTNMLESKK